MSGWILLALLAGTPEQPAFEGRADIVVLENLPDEGVPAPGTRPGDRLTGWRRAASPLNPEPAEGRFTAPYLSLIHI